MVLNDDEMKIIGATLVNIRQSLIPETQLGGILPMKRQRAKNKVLRFLQIFFREECVGGQIKQSTQEVASLTFNNIEDVCMFWASLLADLMHDVGCANIYRLVFGRKGLPRVSTPEFLYRFIEKSGACHAVILEQIGNVLGTNPNIQACLDYLFLTSDGTQYRDAKESGGGVESRMVRIIETCCSNYLAEVSVQQAQGIIQSLGNNIVFDQSSKGSGIRLVDPDGVNILSSIAVMADKGESQPNNVTRSVVDFFKSFIVNYGVSYCTFKADQYRQQSRPDYANEIAEVGQYLSNYCRNGSLSGANASGILAAFKKYTFDTAYLFRSNINYGGKAVFSCMYRNATINHIRAAIGKHRDDALNSLQYPSNSYILSAKAAKGKSTVYEALHKTAGDLNLILYAVLANATLLTGDRCAYCMAAILSASAGVSRAKNGTGTFEPILSYAFETSRTNLIVPTVAARTRSGGRVPVAWQVPPSAAINRGPNNAENRIETNIINRPSYLNQNMFTNQLGKLASEELSEQIINHLTKQGITLNNKNRKIMPLFINRILIDTQKQPFDTMTRNQYTFVARQLQGILTNTDAMRRFRNTGTTLGAVTRSMMQARG